MATGDQISCILQVEQKMSTEHTLAMPQRNPQIEKKIVRKQVFNSLV